MPQCNASLVSDVLHVQEWYTICPGEQQAGPARLVEVPSVMFTQQENLLMMYFSGHIPVLSGA